jgi:hypothetical protein
LSDGSLEDYQAMKSCDKDYFWQSLLGTMMAVMVGFGVNLAPSN